MSNRPPENPPAIFLASTDLDLPDPLPTGLAKYTGFHEMASGGNAVLRSARDTITGRTVAIKTLQYEFRNNNREQRRFLREARVTAQLQHPGIVPVYEIGVDEKQGLYFSMKRISGENFFEVLKRIAQGDQATADAFPIARRLDIVADACQALAYAHARGVIHRDVKPENLWVGNFGEVIVLDWGAAKVWGQSDELLQPQTEADQAERPQTLTLDGQRPGTPLYMSPEQVSRKGSLDERTDIFSMGVVMYEMLTFREPFRGKVIADTFKNIAELTPPPPSELAPMGSIPDKLDATIMRAMSKSPGDRQGTMFQMLTDIRAAMHDLPD